MSRLFKIAKTIRNNWKKSTVAFIALVYGVDFGKEKYMTHQMMRAYCEEAGKYGDVALPVGSKPRHVTVILNPSAKDGKGVKLYEKYSAPLLHLSGLKVSLVKTEYEGQAKSLLDIMENTDAVLIAGGDGTLMETITGLCRRDDADSAIQRFPIGILPIGKTNTAAKTLFRDHCLHEAKLLAEATMSVIKNSTRSLNVMSVQRESGQPVYAVSQLEWGQLRDVRTKIPKYWYWGPLKTKVAYIFAALKGKPVSVTGELSYTEPCLGCSKCYIPPTNLASASVPNNQRWWHIFQPKLKKPSDPRKQVDYSSITNPSCGVWKTENFSASEFIVATDNTPGCEHLDEIPSLRIILGVDQLSRTEFITRGWKKHAALPNTQEHDASRLIHAEEVKLIPTLEQEKENWFSIDTEDHEAAPLQIKFLREKIVMFAPHV